MRLGIVAAGGAGTSYAGKRNSLQLGLTNGDALTGGSGGNTGGGGNYANAITLENSAAVTWLSAANLTAAYAGGMRSALTTTGTAATWDWTATSAVQGYLRAYILWPSSNPGQNTRLMRVQAAGTVIWDVRRVASTSRLALTAGNTTESQSITLTGNTIYRIEAGSDSSGNVTMRVYQGDSTTQETITGTGLTGMGAWDTVRFGLISNAQTYSADFAALGHDPTGWIGAAA